MELVYPHRLTLLKRGKCDVCHSKGRELVRANALHYFGWETCNNEQCNKTIQNWYCKTSIPYDKLREQFGEWVYVQRKGGKFESGWVITSDANQENAGGPFWVRVKHNKRHLSKEVQLEDLRKWNMEQK
jgi:hypothetical protein